MAPEELLGGFLFLIGVVYVFEFFLTQSAILSSISVCVSNGVDFH